MSKFNPRKTATAAFYMALAAVMAIGGLTGCDDKIRAADTAEIDTRGIFQFGKLQRDANEDRTVEILSVGAGALQISSFTIEFDGDNQRFRDDFTLYFKNGRDDPSNLLIDAEDNVRTALPMVIQPEDSVFLVLNYVARTEGTPEGRVVLRTNDSDEGLVTIPITISEGSPEIVVSPGSYDYGRVAAGQTAEHDFIVTNQGQLPLEINQILLNGSQDFIPLVQDGDTLKDPRRIDRDVIQTLQPGDNMTITVRYEPQVEGPDTAELSISSNDPRSPEVNVTLTANGATPCLNVTPPALEFRTSLVNRTDSRPLTLESCGGASVKIGRLYLAEEGDPAFDLVEPEGVNFPIQLPAYTQEDQSAGAPAPSQPLEIQFTPREQRIHNGKLVIESTDPTGEPVNPGCAGTDMDPCWYRLEVNLLGRGVLNACPQARAMQEEFNVVPLDVVTLDGTPSIDQDGPDNRPVRYEWVITSRPDGSTSQPRESFFDPAQPANDGPEDDLTTPSSFFFVDIAGTYTAELRVTDNLGLDSIACENPAVVTIVAQPEEAIHVQLVWRTPLDEDETDEEGSDLDLHLLHPSAENWGNRQVVDAYDCYYLNPTPDWGQLENSDDDPSLDIDDINGAGPENVSLNNPQDTTLLGAPYLVGVYYYSSHGRQTGFDYGPSFARVRIYIRGELAWEYEGSEGDEQMGEKEMIAEDHFWYVAQIFWPSGEVLVRDLYSESAP